MNIQVIGSSSNGNAYLIGGRSRLLLDCGLPIKQLKEATGYNLTALDGCLLTHEHGDHAKAAKDLMKAGVELYASQGTAEALGLTGHRLNIVHARQQFKVGNWTVLPFESIHDAKEPLNYLVQADGKKLAYITDTAYCLYRFQGLTHILIECNYSLEILRNSDLDPGLKRRIMNSHMGLDTVKAFLRANDLGRLQEIWLCHLSDGNSDAEKFKKEIQLLAGKPVYIAQK